VPHTAEGPEHIEETNGVWHKSRHESRHENKERQPMRAVRRTSPGVVEVRDVELGTVGPDEVVVDVEYAGVNPFDAQVLRGEIGADPSRSLTLGAEAAGRVGNRLVLVTGGVGASRDGTFASRVVVPQTSVHEVPADVDPRAVASVGIAGRTAWRALHQIAEVTADDVVLVLGASGGVGSFATQIARNVGARVLAHTGSAEKADRVARPGVEPVVAADAGTVALSVAGAGVTVVLDPLGGDYLGSLLAVLAPRARVVTYGVLAGRQGRLDLGALYGRGIRILGTSGSTTSPQESAAALRAVLSAVSQGAVRIEDEVLPLEEGGAAFRRLAERSVAGKLLLRP
jgi:NADPH2:quinone reductase